MTVRLSEAARVELRGVLVEYDRVSARVRRRFFRALRSAMGLIRDNPELFARYEGGPGPSEFRRVLLDGFPYVLVYAVTETEVVVVAVAHTGRRPGYWDEA